MIISTARLSQLVAREAIPHRLRMCARIRREYGSGPDLREQAASDDELETEPSGEPVETPTLRPGRRHCA